MRFNNVALVCILSLPLVLSGCTAVSTIVGSKPAIGVEESTSGKVEYLDVGHTTIAPNGEFSVKTFKISDREDIKKFFDILIAYEKKQELYYSSVPSCGYRISVTYKANTVGDDLIRSVYFGNKAFVLSNGNQIILSDEDAQIIRTILTPATPQCLLEDL